MGVVVGVDDDDDDDGQRCRCVLSFRTDPGARRQPNLKRNARRWGIRDSLFMSRDGDGGTQKVGLIHGINKERLSLTHSGVGTGSVRVEQTKYIISLMGGGRVG